MSRNKTIRVLIWQDLGGRYFPAGAYRDLSCTHTTDGTWGINMSGEIVPTITATVPVSQPGTNFEKDSLGIRPGKIYVNTAHFGDSSFKSTVRVKDMVNQNTYYVDLTSYNDAIDDCNECCTPTACGDPVPALVAPALSTSADIAWPAVDGVSGYEWVNIQSDVDCEDPVTDGTFTTDVSVALTGLTADTNYCFAVRSICGGGNFSAWALLGFTTAG